MKYVISLIVLGFFFVGSFFVFRSDKPEGSLRLSSLKRGDVVQRVTVGGSIVPHRKALIFAPYAGYIHRLYVKVGDHLQEGAPIVSVRQTLTQIGEVYPIRSPFAGLVVQVPRAEGEFVKDDRKEFIVRVDDLSHLYVWAAAPEMDRVKIKIGQEALIRASAITSRTYKGIVRDLSLAATEKEDWRKSQVDFPIRIEVMDPDDELKPGMSVIADIISQKRADVLRIGQEFVQREGEKYFVILRDGSRREVEVGLSNEEDFEIRSGLKEDESVQQIDFLQLLEKGT